MLITLVVPGAGESREIVARIAREWLLGLALQARGEPLARELQTLERTQWLSAAELQELQRRKLLDLLAYARNAVPFYRDRLSSPLRDDTTEGLLAGVPVLEKADVRQLYAETSKHIQPWRRRVVRRTGGTSGEPLVVLVDPLANARTLAARARALGWFGVARGDLECRLWGRALGRKDRAIGLARDWLLNRIRVSSDELQPDRIQATARHVADRHPDLIYGYSSMVLEFGAVLSPLLARPPKVTVLTSESSRSFQRERLAKSLGCPVVEEYGCSEVDIIGHHCPDGGLHVPGENLLVEVMPKDPQDPFRGDVLVTDLNNRMMPLIRYRVGDEVLLGRAPCSCGRGLPLIESVTGRTLYQYFHLANGRRIHSYIFDYVVDDLVAAGVPLAEYQVRQQSRSDVIIMMVLAKDTPVQRSVVESRGRAGLQQHLGEGVSLRFQFVTTIPKRPGEKRESFVPLRSDGLRHENAGAPESP